jgi:hypothetical protein
MTNTEDIAPGEDADPATAKLAPIEVGQTLPSFVLKNEKDEDVDVSTLTAEKGLVLFLVPKADTRASPSFAYEKILCSCTLQPGARPRRADSGTSTLISPLTTSRSTVLAQILQPLRPSGRRRSVIHLRSTNHHSVRSTEGAPVPPPLRPQARADRRPRSGRRREDETEPLHLREGRKAARQEGPR